MMTEWGFTLKQALLLRVMFTDLAVVFGNKLSPAYLGPRSAVQLRGFGGFGRRQHPAGLGAVALLQRLLRLGVRSLLDERRQPARRARRLPATHPPTPCIDSPRATTHRLCPSGPLWWFCDISTYPFSRSHIKICCAIIVKKLVINSFQFQQTDEHRLLHLQLNKL